MGYHHNDGHNPMLCVLSQPNIELGREVRHLVVELLNITLADEGVLFAKNRSAQANISLIKSIGKNGNKTVYRKYVKRND